LNLRPTGTVGHLLRATTAALGSETEAKWLVSHALGIPSPQLVPRLGEEPGEQAAGAVRTLVARRTAGEPLQYVLGTWAFRTLELRVDGRALIPRPETEEVVTAALEELHRQASGIDDGQAVVAVDLGTGTGAIALSLAVEHGPSRPALEVWATDVSSSALELFEVNRSMLATSRPAAAGRVHTASGSWFDALPADLARNVHLVVSNPPYVSEPQWRRLDPVVRDHEPKVALVSGPSGFEAIDVLLTDASRWLAPGGSLVVELSPQLARAAQERAAVLGYDECQVRDDLSGRARILVARVGP
jgi:release factor glutamine methyltransferase